MFSELSKIAIGWFAYVGIPMSNDPTHIGNITEKRERMIHVYLYKGKTHTSFDLFIFLSHSLFCSLMKSHVRCNFFFFFHFFRLNFTLWAKSSCYVQFIACSIFAQLFFSFSSNRRWSRATKEKARTMWNTLTIRMEMVDASHAFITWT